MGRVVQRTYLELVDLSACPPTPPPAPSVRVERMARCPTSFFRYLYAEVGRPWHWHDRLGWQDEQIQARVAAPAVSLYLLSLAGAPAGYFELERHPDGSVEICYLGLLPEFLGRGLGRYLLSEAVAAARSAGAPRIWLHTCELDGPAALPNYLARGFRPFRTETYTVDLPD